MKAALIPAVNAPLEIADVQPMPLQFGQVRVRVLVSGICGAQLQEIRGEKGNAKLMPHMLGHEGCGIVEEIGPAVTRLKVGQKVVMHWRKAAGVESPFPKYEYKTGIITSGKVTTLAQETVCSENRLTPVDNDAPDSLCALLGCGLSTALGTMENDVGIKYGASVLIIGCGGLGGNLIVAAQLAAASRIAVVDPVPTKEKLAKTLGAREFALDVEDISGNFDVVIDTSGHAQTAGRAFGKLASGGVGVMVGQPREGESLPLFRARHMFDGEGKRILATQGGQFKPDIDIPRYVALWRARVLSVSPLVTHYLPLAKINEAFDLVRAGEAGRILIDCA